MRRWQALLGFGAAFLMGTVFAAVQVLEWRAKTYGLGASSYASLYFVTTGFHMGHVLVGLLILAALAARMTKRPVKLVLTRAQMFTWMGHRPQSAQKMTLLAGPDGRLTGIRHETRQATSTTNEFTLTSGVVSQVLYHCSNVQTPVVILPMNLATPTYMRAPAESSSHTNGIRLLSASSRRRVTFISPVIPIEPAMTVKS